jgi:hypothetical protein
MHGSDHPENDDGESSSFFNQSSTIQSRRSSAASTKNNSSNKPPASVSASSSSSVPASSSSVNAVSSYPAGYLASTVSQSGSHNSSNVQLLTSALEEARVAKLTNLQLNEEKEEITKKYEELAKKYQEISDLLLAMNSRKESFDEYNVDDDLTLSTYPTALPLVKREEDGTVNGKDERVVASSSIGVEAVMITAAVGTNTAPNPQLIELNDKMEQLTLSLQSIKGKLSHEETSHELTKTELKEERQRYLQAKREISSQHSLFLSIDASYKTSLQQLKNSLVAIKSSFSSLSLFYENEKQSTISSLALQLQLIVKSYQNYYEKYYKEKQKEFLRIATQEKDEIEKKYLSQISDISKENEKNLNKLQYSIVTSQQQPASSLSNSSNYLLDEKNRTNDYSSSSFSSSSVSTYDGASSTLPAYKSTLQGLLEGLQDQQVITSEISAKIFSLAEVHSEPSFAATAASRAILGEEIDKFMFSLLHRKYFDNQDTNGASNLGGDGDGYHLSSTMNDRLHPYQDHSSSKEVPPPLPTTSTISSHFSSTSSYYDTTPFVFQQVANPHDYLNLSDFDEFEDNHNLPERT